MVQLILEHLVNGTSPSSISLNIASQAALDITGVKIIMQDIPSINFIQKCRRILRIIVETLAFYCIGKMEQCNKLFYDSTGRHHTAIQNLVIDGIVEELLRPLILSTYIILEGETSEKQVDSVL